MNQERFDELTKALAAPVSRGRMLKLVGGAILGSTLGGGGLLGTKDAEAKKKKIRPKPVKCPPTGDKACMSLVVRTDTGELQPDTPYDCSERYGTGGSPCEKANQDTSYTMLVGYLFAKGFRVTPFEEDDPFRPGKTHLTVVVYEDTPEGFGHREDVLLTRFVKQATGEQAWLRYGVDGDGTISTYALVDKEDAPDYYSLSVGDNGKVKKLTAPPLAVLGADADNATASAANSKSKRTVSVENTVAEYFAPQTNIACAQCYIGCEMVLDPLAQKWAGIFTTLEVAQASLMLKWRWRKILFGTPEPKNCDDFCKQELALLTRYSEEHCGECFNPCAAGSETCCDGTCVDPKSDEVNCGGCLSLRDGMRCYPKYHQECCQGRCYSSICSETGKQRDPITCRCDEQNGCGVDDGSNCGPRCLDCRNTPLGTASRYACDDGTNVPWGSKGACLAYLPDGTRVMFDGERCEKSYAGGPVTPC
jgi:hypothetical protein